MSGSGEIGVDLTWSLDGQVRGGFNSGTTDCHGGRGDKSGENRIPENCLGNDLSVHAHGY